MQPETNSYDFVIIGAGTAGLAVAKRLSQAYGQFSVCVLEAGNSLKPDRKDVAMTVMATAVLAKKDEIVWPYKTSPQSQLNGREVDLPAGRVLGGSSNLNYAIWTRGNATDFDFIAKISDNPSWAFDRLLPYFKKSETFHFPKDSLEFKPALHGNSGPIHVVPYLATGREFKWRTPTAESYKRAGFVYKADINDGETLGYGDLTSSAYFQGGGRQSSRTYITEKPDNLTIFEGQTVSHVLFEGTRAIGVETIHGEKYSARKEGMSPVLGVNPATTSHNIVVLVCAGALRSPAILQLSGIGPEDLLKSLDIPTVAVSPGVGENFWDHPILHLRWRVKEAARGDTVDDLRVPARIQEEMAAYAANGTGLLGGNPFEFTAWKNLSDICSQALQKDTALHLSSNYQSYLESTTTAHSQYLIAYGFANGRNVQGPDSHISISPMLVTPTARGFVRITSKDPAVLPTFNPNWLGTDTDMELMKAAVKTGAAMMQSPVWKEFLDTEVTEENGVLGFSDEIIDQRLKDCAVTTWHYGGTCAMGSQSNTEVAPVVDSECRVYGVNGLRVIDMSVYPIPISANTQAATYALAEKIADVILTHYRI
ncbi:hypothetical protein ONZ45_g8458 [Pleurotus djamor]|nr:hypothetical protein ONZ45_g8458 [Pleurotus djamor]